jgi:hypothetical protein
VVQAQRAAPLRWYNVYGAFGERQLWPRGFPLEALREADQSGRAGVAEEFWAPIQQGLANGSPDVDAVWRLVLDRDVRFPDRPSVALPRGTWCPFNSQSTWWRREVMPLLYLPSHCSFRMTDIWRSFVAQRCVWELGTGVVFHGAEVEQERNPHRLLRDFEQEIPGYLHNQRLVDVLEGLELGAGPGSLAGNLHRCYQALVRERLVDDGELSLVDAWLEACEAIGAAPKA